MRPARIQSSTDGVPSLLVSVGLSAAPHGRDPVWLIRALRSLPMMWPLLVIARCAVFFSLNGKHTFDWVMRDWVVALLLLCGLLTVDAAIILLPRVRAFQARLPHLQLRAMLPLIFLSGTFYALIVRTAIDLGVGYDGAVVVFVVAVPAIVAVGIFGAQRLLGFIYCFACVLPFLTDLTPKVPLTIPFVGLVGLLLAALVQARSDQTNLQSRVINNLLGEQALALLNDFEDARRGWFWETDRSGNLTYISNTLARQIGASAEDLLAKPITGLFEHSAGTGRNEGERTIGFHLSARSAFSDVAVRAHSNDGERWWSLSGRPIVNEFGQFLGFRGSGADLTEMRKSQAEVVRLARFDELTGLANRSHMMETLEQLLVDPRGRAGACALFILDLDRFKSVNDTMGHPAGDTLLRQVAQRLLRVVGTQGKVGRLGGDEFQILLPGITDRPALAKLSENIIHTVSQPYAIEGTQVVIGVSVGIALAPNDGSSAEMLIRNADLALYKAKDSGRGAFRFYSQDLHADAEDRRKLEQDLRHAIHTGALHVEYQPVVTSTSERVSGFEALVRWHHPTRGAVSPALFIPVAEEAGLIGQVGEWVLRTACNDAAGWPDGVRVAVNVSPIQFGNPSFPALVMNALAKSGLSPERLELEITESVFLNEDNDTDSMFTNLKALGVRLALDDFGTGYSALGYLKTAPFDKIKIDQSFVRGAAIKGSRNGAIVKSIVSLAEALQMETTAEGAETLDELELIRSLGCSHIQGYIYGRPVRNSEVMARFAAGQVHITPSGFKASREPRRTMLRSVRLIHGDSAYDARIRNISASGAMVEGVTDVPPNTRFIIDMGNGQMINAICRWSSGDRMGMEFADGLETEVEAPVRVTETAPTTQYLEPSSEPIRSVG